MGDVVAQCGGSGNTAHIAEVLATVGDGWIGPWNFATPEDTVARLVAAGFVDTQAWLTDTPEHFATREEFVAFLRTVILGAHLDRLPPEEHDAFVENVAGRLRHRVVDYVRLNLRAVRPA